MQELPQTQSDVVSYSKSSTIQPSYQFVPVFQENNTQEVTINATAGQYSLFEIPVEVLNLSKSELCFTSTPAIPGGAGRYTKAVLSAMPYFTQIQLLSRKGQQMVEINNADRVSAILRRACVRLNDMLNQDVTSGSLTRINIVGTTQRLDGTTANVPYTEMKYVECSTANNGAQPVIKYKIPLKNLGLDTLLEMDKDLFFGEIIRLKFTWSTRDKIGFYGTSVDDNAAGAAVLATNVGISGLVLRLAIQRDERLVQFVKSKYSSGGISLLIPYVTSYARTLPAGADGSNNSIDLKLDANHGHSLLRVYHSAFSPSGTAGKEYETSNLADAKIYSYNTSLDRKKMQQFDFDTSEGDDYQYHREMLEDTSIQNMNVYQYNWFHCDDFTGFKSATDRRAYLKNVACGLPLAQEKSWSFYATVKNVPIDHLTVVVSQKALSITPSGISVM